MKGLFIKDLKLIKSQNRLAAIFAAALLLYVFAGMSASFIISYTVVICASLTASTISFDEYDNGNAFLFTLPFSRREYVRAKYAFGAAIGTFFWTVSLILTFLADKIRHVDLTFSEYAAPALLSLAVFFLLTAVILPLQLKFGGNRGTIAMIVFFMLAALLGWITVNLLKNYGNISAIAISLENIFADTISSLAAGAVAVIASVLVFLISCRISNVIVEKKEF